MKYPLLASLLCLCLSLQAQKVSWNPNHKDKPLSEQDLESIESALPEKPFAEPKTPRKLLIYSATAGFRHH